MPDRGIFVQIRQSLRADFAPNESFHIAQFEVNTHFKDI